jgi:Topoisomerase 6 subunit A/Spo11, Toprim domain
VARDSYSYLICDDSHDFYFDAQTLLGCYAAFNPHANFYLGANGDSWDWDPTEGEFKRWLPNKPPSPHWYNLDRFCSLIGAYLSKERSGGKTLTVREFVSKFRGVSGSAKLKAVTDEAQLTNCLLSNLIVNGDVSRGKAECLLHAMKDYSDPVKPAQLGVIGEDHMKRYLTEHHLVDDPDAVKHRKVEGEFDGLPFVVEVAFGLYAEEWREYRKAEILGLNWAPGLRAPFRELPDLLAKVRVDEHDPVVVVVHIVCPHFTFTDRGKGALVLPHPMSEALEKAIRAVTRGWKKIKRQADRDDKLSKQQLDRYAQQQKTRALTVKDASYHVMKTAYLKASADGEGGTLPVKPRQIMYAARRQVIDMTGNPNPWPKSAQFSSILEDYRKDYSVETESWDVVYDARGHLIEPHTGESLGLGTLEVRDYIREWHSGKRRSVTEGIERLFSTRGPGNRFRFALFIEKEGFNELWNAVRLQERYDLALMSTKGMSVTAARQVIEAMSEQGVTTLILRDFDKSGFSIAHTLCNDTERFQFKTKPKVIDLGLRLADVERLGLDSEQCEFKDQKDPRINLRERGATEEEIDFLVRGRKGGKWFGERVEINQMTSRQLVDWLESKLIDLGASKVIPDDDVLTQAWREALLHKKALDAFNKIIEEGGVEIELLPGGLRDEIWNAIDGKAESWDQVLWRRALNSNGA